MPNQITDLAMPAEVDMTNVPTSNEDNNNQDTGATDLLDTRTLLLLVISIGGAYLATRSSAWAVGLIAFAAIATLLNGITRR